MLSALVLGSYKEPYICSPSRFARDSLRVSIRLLFVIYRRVVEYKSKRSWEFLEPDKQNRSGAIF